MVASANQIYHYYANYVAELWHALSALPSGPVAEEFRVRLLPPEEFASVWANWETFPGLQEKWSERFRAGYWASVQSISDRLRTGFATRFRSAA